MAMYKGKKQRIHGRGYRYSSHYGKKNNTSKVIITLLVCVALIACGYFISTLFFDRMGGGETASSQPTESLQNSSFTVSYEDIGMSEEASSQIQAVATEGNVYLAEYDEYSDATALAATISKAKEGGYDTLMLNIKSQDGILHYESANEIAIEADAVEETVELEKVINEIRAAGLGVGAKINVFDEYCLAWHDRTTALLANVSTKTLWYEFVTRDISSGSPWLDPSDEQARRYNLDIISELSSFDIDCIYLEGAHFPVWGKINVYKLDETVDREETITSFISEARDITKAQGKRLGVIVPLCGAVGDYNERWASYGYPDDVYSLDADTVVIDARADRVFMQSWYDEMTVGELVIEDLEEADAAQYSAVYAKINELYLASGSKSELVFWAYEAEDLKLPQDEIVNKMIKS